MALATIAFSPDPGKILDFTGHSPASIFNNAILPRINKLSEFLPQQEAYEEPSNKSTMDVASALNREDEQFLSQVQKPATAVQPQGQDLSKYEGGYDEPLPTKKSGIKLSNYGYSSDSSPDHNSNVLRIGHSNNQLEDGVSAALTKSLARHHGLKTGDMFEAVTSDGKVLQRRYDDTVPTTYKGKPLPETVDLYELGGSNKFGGTVVEIRPLRR